MGGLEGAVAQRLMYVDQRGAQDLASIRQIVVRPEQRGKLRAGPLATLGREVGGRRERRAGLEANRLLVPPDEWLSEKPEAQRSH
jgi:hypothetical protein